MGARMATGLQMSGRASKKLKMTNLTIPNNMFSMKFALKSVPGLAAIGVLHGGEDGSLFCIFMAFDFKGHETKCQQWQIRYIQTKFKPDQARSG